MIVKVMPVAGVRVLGRGGVVSIERVAKVIDDSMQIVQRATLLTCQSEINSRSSQRRDTIRYVTTTTIRFTLFTARCTLVQSAVLRSYVVRPSVRLSV